MRYPLWAVSFIDCYIVLENGISEGPLELRADTDEEETKLIDLLEDAENNGFWDPSHDRLDYRALEGYTFYCGSAGGEVDPNDYATGRGGLFLQNTFYLHEIDWQRKVGDLDGNHCWCLNERDCLICRLQREVKVSGMKQYRAEQRANHYLQEWDKLSALLAVKEAEEAAVEEEVEREEAGSDDPGNESSGDKDSVPLERGRGGKTRPGMGGRRKRLDEVEEVADEITDDEEDVSDDEDFEPAPKRQKTDLSRGRLATKAPARIVRSVSVDIPASPIAKPVRVVKARKTNTSVASYLDEDVPIAKAAKVVKARKTNNSAATYICEDSPSPAKPARPAKPASPQKRAPKTSGAAGTASGNGRSKGWSDEERKALIHLVAAHRNPPPGSKQEILYDVRLFQLISTQLEEQYGIKRSAGGCKNEFNRRGREEGQVDNRKVANANRMATSIQ